MFKRFGFVIVLFLILCISMTGIAFAGSGDTPDPDGYVTLDVLINVENGELSIGGFTANDLAQFFIRPLNEFELGFIRFDSIRAQSGPRMATLTYDNENTIALLWTPQQINGAFKIVDDFLGIWGFGIPVPIRESVINWMDTSLVQIDVRTTEDEDMVSEPAKIVIPEPVHVDVGLDGSIKVENFPIENLDPGVEEMISTAAIYASLGGIEDVVVCSNKGTITPYVNGLELFDVTIFQGGVEAVFADYPEISVENLDPVWLSVVGANFVVQNKEGLTIN